ncbi:ankyrin, partial [Neurospora tetrasperma FGSC 2509]
MIAKHADVNLVDSSKRSALHHAAEIGSEDLVRLLLEERADPSLESNSGQIALDYASLYGHDGNTSVVELLLDNGVDINAVDQYKNTALHFAAFGDRVNMAKLLVMRNARLDCPDNGGFTPLMDAARTGSLSSMKVLIDAGANLEALNDSGLSALDLA